MRTEDFRYGLISISLIFALMLSTALIHAPVRVAANIVSSLPSPTTVAIAPEVQQWDAIITATFPNGSDDAIFGVRPDATAGFDDAYDLPEPPPPVEPPYVRAFFYYPGNDPLPTTLHKSCIPPGDIMQWPLRVSYRNGTDNITLSWSLENVPPDYAVLLFNSENLVANMRAVDNYTFQAASGDFDFTIRVAVAMWKLIETWAGTLEAPVEWQLFETWNGTIETPAEWQQIENWIGITRTPVPLVSPLLISPADGTITSDNTPTFDWSDVTGAENYDLLVDNDSDFSSPEIQVTLPVSTYTPTSGLPEDNYSWKVRARDAANNLSDWSSVWTLLISVEPGIGKVICPAAADVYAFGGNETGYSRPQLKFDIRSIPSRSNILSAKLWLYRFAADNWDGEILLNRVDDQLWGENITATEFNAQTLTDGEDHASKFMSPGWDYLDVENQLNVDHEAGNGYSSYRLRWANDNGGEPSVGIDDGRFLHIESRGDELSIIFSSSEYNGSDPYLEVIYLIFHGWDLIDTWTSTIEASAEWQIMESWTGTVSTPIGWNLIETWTKTVSAPARWQTVEIWTGPVKTPPAPAKWQTVEIWTGAVKTPPAPAKWELIETWRGALSTPFVAPPSKPPLISPPDGTTTDDNAPTFDWSDVTRAENYDLLVDNDPDFSSPKIQVTVPVSTYTPTSGLPDGKYWWKVRARDTAGNVSEWSSTWTLIIKTIFRAVEVSISPESKSGAPEEMLTYEVTVKNTGSIDDNYTLRVVGEFDWSVSIEPTSLTLDAGTSRNATLSVIIPENAENGTSMTTTVSAISVGDPTVTDSDTCRTDVTVVPEKPEFELPIPLAISMVLIGAAVIVPGYLLHVRRRRAARRRVLRAVALSLGAALLAVIYLLRGRRRDARRRVLRGPRRL